MSYTKNELIQAADSASIDAFARLRIASPITLFDSKLLYDSQPFLWNEATNGAGSSIAYVSNTSSVTLNPGTTSGGYAIRQTKKYFNYQPGKGQLLFFTFNLNGATANISKKVGYFDSNNGLFFELNGIIPQMVIRSKVSGVVVDSATIQNDWNIDKMDGTGPSGVDLDWTKAQILIIDFQWLGVGRVRFGFVVDGKIYYCHYTTHSNVITKVYDQTPNLPIRYEILNLAITGGTETISEICASVISEAGYHEKGIMFSADRGITTQTLGNNTNNLPLISLRLNTANPYVDIDIEKFSILCTTNGGADFRWSLVLNPTITGGTAASWTSLTNSYVQYDVARTGTISGGTPILSGYVSTISPFTDVFTSPSASAVSNVLPLTLNFAQNVADELVLCAQRTTTGTTRTFLASISWREII